MSDLEIKAIALVPAPTRDDPKPRTIQPTTTEGTSRWGLQAYFPMPRRPFHLEVTLSDGSVHDVDVYRKVPPSEPKFYRVGPERLIAPRGVWTD